jgi:hypothetical protein
MDHHVATCSAGSPGRGSGWASRGGLTSPRPRRSASARRNFGRGVASGTAATALAATMAAVAPVAAATAIRSAIVERVVGPSPAARPAPGVAGRGPTTAGSQLSVRLARTATSASATGAARSPVPPAPTAAVVVAAAIPVSKAGSIASGANCYLSWAVRVQTTARRDRIARTSAMASPSVSSCVPRRTS